MKILYVAGRELNYSRTRNVYHALKNQNFDIKGCFPADRSFKHYPWLILRAIWMARSCDVVIVGFYGQLLLPCIKLFTRKPILFDMYIATLDTMVSDRAKAKPDSLKARIYKFSDRLACALSRLIILETHDHIEDFAQKFRIDKQKFHRIFLAVDDRVIYPRKRSGKSDSFLVHFHGEYAPFHGVDTIIRAAQLLEHEKIEFQIVGRGITYERDRNLARTLGCQNIRFIDPVPYEQLADLIASADLCLGIFGNNDRMLRVTTNKVIESIAMAKPLVTGRNQPVQELLTHGVSAFLVERGNPQALADAIVTLKQNPEWRNRMAQNGYKVAQQHCTLDQLGRSFAKVLNEITDKSNR
ncbi:glycosyltransferase [candidate division KSB1 bacterium]|nr:glycosyltransferase [candidate division KSB1 bacterium]